jgi:hypothetical protein
MIAGEGKPSNDQHIVEKNLKNSKNYEKFVDSNG